MGREQRGARCSCSTVAYGSASSANSAGRRPTARGCRVDPAHLGGATVVGCHAALVGRSRGGADSVAEAGSDISSAPTRRPCAVRVGPSALPGCARAVGDAAQVRRREAKGVIIEGRQTGGPPRRQARPSGPPAGGVHAGCSRAPVTIRGEIRWTRSASATMRVTRAGKASGVALVCQGARRDGGAAREAGPRVGKRPGDGVPSMVELTLRAGRQPWTQKPPTRDRAEARSLRHDRDPRGLAVRSTRWVSCPLRFLGRWWVVRIWNTRLVSHA